MLWALVILLILAWCFGFVTHMAGAMIHLLLVAAAALTLMNLLLSGRRSII